MKVDNKFLIIFILIWSIVSLQAQTAKKWETDRQKWDVSLSVSSLEAILLHPDKILENPDAFWETDSAYKLVKGWHQSNKIAMDTRNYYENWLTFLKTQAKIPEEERQNNPAFKLLKEIIDRIPVFKNKSIPLLNEFLPQNKLKFKTTIYITGKTFPWAMMYDGKIMADVLSKRFDNDPDKVLNLLTHECFHIGYGFNRYLRREMELGNDFIYNTMLDALQNEGLATYVGYKAKEIFPVKELPDYRMLDSLTEVKRQLNDVNNLFTIADTLSIDSLRKRSWEIGVNQRGYYVVGAYMAKTIDQQIGRRALLKTIVMGPLNFVDMYNDLVSEDMRVVKFKKPKELSLVQKLKKAIENGDQSEFEKIAAKMKAEKEELPSPTQQRLERLGYGMIYQESFERAIEIFKLDVALFPKSANSYDCLAEAYMKADNKELAIKNYKKSLELNPENDNAKKMLEQLQK